MGAGVLLFLKGYGDALALATSEGMSGVPGAGRRDSGGGFRRLGSMKLPPEAEGLVWAHCRIQGMAGAPVAGGIDSGGDFRRRGSMESPTAADGLVRALRQAGGAPSLPVPLRLPSRRSAGFVVIGLLRFVFAMAKVKRCEEEGIVRGAGGKGRHDCAQLVAARPCDMLKVRSSLAIYSKRFTCFAIYSKSFIFL